MMIDLNPKDFQRIRSVLQELVRESKFFPATARDDDWFHPWEENDRRSLNAERNVITTTAAAAAMTEKRRHIRAQSEDGHRSTFSCSRRPRCHSMDSLESSSTTEASSTSLSSSSSSSFDQHKSVVEIFENTTPPIENAATDLGDDVLHAVPFIREQDVEPRSILGRGGFCEVRLVNLKMRRCNQANRSNTSR